MTTEGDRSSIAESYYQRHSTQLLMQYESVGFETIHADMATAIGGIRTGIALDVGCGSGRDAAWLADRGWSVVAVDPSQEMLEGARRLHGQPNITWLLDGLPSLAHVIALNRKFDLVLLSAVWMHVPGSSQEEAVRNIASLCGDQALVYLTLRSGPFDRERGFYDTPISDLVAVFGRYGMQRVNQTIDFDAFGRHDVQWQKLTLKKSG